LQVRNVNQDAGTIVGLSGSASASAFRSTRLQNGIDSVFLFRQSNGDCRSLVNFIQPIAVFCSSGSKRGDLGLLIWNGLLKRWAVVHSARATVGKATIPTGLCVVRFGKRILASTKERCFMFTFPFVFRFSRLDGSGWAVSPPGSGFRFHDRPPASSIELGSDSTAAHPDSPNNSLSPKIP